MRKILERALDHLNSINNSSAGMLSHPLDESRTKEMLNFLKSEGVELDHGEILTWGLAKGWEHRNAKELADLAEKINAGRRVVIKFPGRLGDRIKSELRALK
ncbi:DUF1889 family protein [Edwardsiella piscicida]|uniref:DUF1889 family protein n=1 Tax=Edwardsiella piscicida TaxID=1263550 RepID=UPI0018C8C3D1|nr:DUF1889 family protein [Edwardsiella piscicida]WLJ46301.1 DUF1889 family protein [Edwardsiella piscicida]